MFNGKFKASHLWNRSSANQIAPVTFCFRWLVNDRAGQGTINHTSWAVDVTLIHNISLWFVPWFSTTRTYTLHRQTHTYTHWHPRTDGFSYMAAWGCSIGFKNTHNICKALWLIILVLQCNHAIWAWAMAEHEPYGKQGDDEASTSLMKAWGPWLHTHTHTAQDINFTHILLWGS